MKYIRYHDKVLNQNIVAIEGFQWPSDLMARIFVARIPIYHSGSKEIRFFPQIDDDIKENVIIIGDIDKGYHLISEAKRELEKEFDKYIKTIDIKKYITCQ